MCCIDVSIPVLINWKKFWRIDAREEEIVDRDVRDPLEFSSNKNMLDVVFDSVDLLQKRKEFTTEDDSNVDKS
ncbi:hypothetical protein H5410_059857 [Solanum commersonii]|uniref:Uncharacterized protein n=1 Tax=Solanum commersonii TaxID=4109 RepID=A0A9J5W3I2_SOLCO|nr:hypothetical protein H5410_059857 [Solanum commersonii]